MSSNYEYNPCADREMSTTSTDTKLQTSCPSTWKVAVMLLVGAALFFLGLLSGYFILHFTTNLPATPDLTYCNQGKSEHIYTPSLHLQHDNILKFINLDRIVSTYRNFSNSSLKMGSVGDHHLSDKILETFSLLGMEHKVYITANSSHSTPYVDDICDILYTNTGNVVPIAYKSSTQHLRGYAEFSANSDVTAKLINVNYGDADDYKYITAQSINLEGKIALIRGPRKYAYAKSLMAQYHGLVGVIYYIDHHTDQDLTHCDNTVSLLSYDYLNDIRYIDFSDVFTLQSRSSNLTIPVVPISCIEATELMSHLTAYRAPPQWRYPVQTYITQHEDSDWSVHLCVNHSAANMPSKSIISTITGYTNPDQYIIIGASRSNDMLGHLSTISGTTVLMELAHMFSDLMKFEDWMPDRTLKFCSWGGHGDQGIIDYLQSAQLLLPSHTVTYIDLDDPIKSLHYQITAPVAFDDVIYGVAQMVSSPGAQNTKLYDSWLTESVEINDHGQPSITRAETKAEQHPFSQLLGVNSVHVQLPMEHVSFYLDHLVSGVESLETVSSFCSLLVLSLCDATVLQLNISSTSLHVQHQIMMVLSQDWVVLDDVDGNVDDLKGSLLESVNSLVTTAASMQYYILNLLNYEESTQTRLTNEVLLKCQVLLNLVRHQIEKLSTQILTDNKTADIEPSLTLAINYLRTCILALQTEL